MTTLHWQQYGQGHDIVLLHGWGMNGAVWQKTVEQLAPHYCVHVVDLPGYGHSAECDARSLDEICQQLMAHAPSKATWIGWSLGGVIATHLALHYPDTVARLITVASSPCFAATDQPKPWRGILPTVLTAFQAQLRDDFNPTIERFMALQAMGSPTARQDVKALKQAVLSRPQPNAQALQLGLELLATVDLRAELAQLSLPCLRLYGRLDGLVPIQVASDVMRYQPKSAQHTFLRSSHAPFITEAELFAQVIIEFINNG